MKILIVSLLVILASSTLTLDQYPEYQNETPEVIFGEIQHSQEQNHPNIPKLVFITPWNHQGKRLTVKYAQKLKYVSPCWFQLIVRNGKIVFQNTELADREYLTQIKSANPNIKILPRVYVNNFEVFTSIGSSRQNFNTALKLIYDMLKRNPVYDGIVWDSPYNLFTADKNMAPLNQLIFQFVNQLNTMFDSVAQQEMLLFFNIANPSKRQLDTSLYRNIKIEGLLIQNYDTPLDFIQMLKNSVQWVKDTKPWASQIIMMLPFFSYKNGQGISTLDAKKQLQIQGIFSYGFQRGMCRFLSQKKRKYLVPCYKYFSSAYSILQGQGYSAGFWQGGNGLENYYVFM